MGVLVRHEAQQRALPQASPVIAMLILVLLLAFGAIGQQCALILTASGGSTTGTSATATLVASAPIATATPEVGEADALAQPTTGTPGCDGRPEAPTAETDLVRTVLFLDGAVSTPAPLHAPDSGRRGTDAPSLGRDVPHRTHQDLCISRT